MNDHIQHQGRICEAAPDFTAVFLDRDGVINEKMPEGEYVCSARDFRILPGVPDAIARLNRAQKRVLIVSNQRGIALGRYTASDVKAIHSRLQELISPMGAHVDGFYFCPHDKAECGCRKPLTGMFGQAQFEFPDIRPQSSIMIGDSLSDVVFGQRLGMFTIFIAGDAARVATGVDQASRLADRICNSLQEAVDELFTSRK
jgi:D-glycero-D-manno-heptose 1,7-bisphosphate phosphatase